ncbi:TetR/AcrR family transcriptional regulator [Bacillus sp. CH30_1T]|uniref:TetR/AcrR family transcriptional regulator n=1 Tax=Bacillus sp. CH30_1T TaxID=2604836 RepID=UPI0011EF3899|nr:TetR/AcrR family transcriptional regulator [Bacillus sp. CH30_1T]KAA0566691.1 TetR/AcrR family transcriptional regulator [Bacillus sp. CH30_1T]
MSKGKTLSELKEKEREARRQLILSAATELFSSQPISKVGIRDIAKKAGISPALIYRHFNDRDELFIEAFFMQSEKIASAFERLIQEEEQRSTQKVGELYVTFLLENDEFFQMMTHFMLDHVIREEAMEPFDKSMRRLLAAFDASFEGMEIKEDVRLHTHAFFSSLNGVLITFRNYPGRSEEEVRKHIFRLTEIICSKFRT